MNNVQINQKMTSKTIKIILFAGIIGAMILPFNMMDFVEAEEYDKNPKDKTLERIQEKNVREKILKTLKSFDTEKNDLKEKIKSKSESEKQKINKRINEIKSEIDRIKKENHKNDIPRTQLEKLINQQNLFEERLQNLRVVEFITSVGIDITSKEIQIGLDQDRVNSENIGSIVSIIDRIMPNNTKWHIVYSDAVTFLSCTQNECTPLIGGNYIQVTGKGGCSFGFQATKNNVSGWITAGHCADGRVGSSVSNHSGDTVGTVSQEKFYWGTPCDCAWITGNSNLFNNEVFDVPSTHTITKTTQASQQQNDIIMKSGATGGLDFGTVSATNVSVYSPLEGYYVKHLVRSNTIMNHGDSGGTIVESSDRGDLYGIATAHDWWGYYHTPIDQITAHMGVLPVLN